MQTDESIDRLNSLSKPSAAAQKPLSPQQLQELFRHPPRQANFDEHTDLVASIVEAFLTSDSSGRQRIVSRLSEHTSGALRAYAFKMSTEAVRQTSPDMVVRGLVALVIDGGRRDIRDCIIGMALLYHSALKLGMDAKSTFDTNASLSRSLPFRQAMREFPNRQPADRNLAAFYFREVTTPSGFTYEQVLPFLSAR